MQSIIHSVNQLRTSSENYGTEAAIQPASHSVSKLVSHSLNNLVSQSISQSVSQPANHIRQLHETTAEDS